MSNNMKSEKNNELCFSKTHFDSVYDFILMKTQQNKTKEYIHGDWEIVVSDSSELFFKKKGYSLSKVNRESGIFSFPKLDPDNERITLKTNQLFCELILLAKNQNYE
jgi:hypothetical protein